MRDLDEQWMAHLVARTGDLDPEVHVDVLAALRAGRRRRTRHRAVVGAALLAVVVGAGVGVPSLPRLGDVHGVIGGTDMPVAGGTGYAEVVDAAPGCAWLNAAIYVAQKPQPTPDPGLDIDQAGPSDGPENGAGTIVNPPPPPRPGLVPPEFEPVTVAYCRGEYMYGYQEVLLRGDLEPLLAFLAQPSPVDGPLETATSCSWEEAITPQVYLIDAAGRAVDPGWPTDKCREPVLAGLTLLDALTEVAADAPAITEPAPASPAP